MSQHHALPQEIHQTVSPRKRVGSGGETSVGRRFVILYACLHIVSVRDHALLHLVWERD